MSNLFLQKVVSQRNVIISNLKCYECYQKSLKDVFRSSFLIVLIECHPNANVIFRKDRVHNIFRWYFSKIVQ